MRRLKYVFSSQVVEFRDGQLREQCFSALRDHAKVRRLRREQDRFAIDYYENGLLHKVFKYVTRFVSIALMGVDSEAADGTRNGRCGRH